MAQDATPSAGPVLPHRHLWSGLPRAVLAEVGWSFTPPWTWLLGVAANLVLSVVWLIWVPVTGRSHSDWVIVVGTYFAVFILADVTTTNVLGPDARRVRPALQAGVPITRILLVKNLALIAIVGLPTLLLTAILTSYSETPHRLVLTLPGVALPILAWLGVGNLVSVLLPVETVPLAQRWWQRRDLISGGRWLAHLAVPYALLYAVDPVGDLPHTLLQTLPRAWRTEPVRGMTLAATGLLIWALGTVLATSVVRLRGVRIR